MKSLLSYIPETPVMEAINNARFADALSIIEGYFKKNGIWTHKDITNIQVEHINYYGTFVYNCNTMNGCYFLWEQTGSTELQGIAFTNNASLVIYNMMNGGTMKFNVSVDCKGTSLAAILPLVKDVILGKAKMDGKTIQDFFEKHQMYENLNEEDATALRQRRNYLNSKRKVWAAKGKDTAELDAEIDQLDIQIKNNVAVRIQGTAAEIEAQEEEFEDRATPEERFKDMEHYINMVIKGLKPSAVICGAPGVGKTFRVMRKVKASGANYCLIKGKETAMAFYQHLFLYRHEHDLIICDDADDVLTDDVITNLIKAATDSSDERIVTYGTSRPPILTEEEFMSLPPEDQAICGLDVRGGKEIHFYPKSFETKAGFIIITNYTAGQIDTAVRNRALVCDLAFTTEELLGLVKDIMPAIKPDKIRAEAKIKAMTYLEQLAKSGSKMEISIRSFCTVAEVYEDVEDEAQAERMIREQMKMQALRGGKKH